MSNPIRTLLHASTLLLCLIPAFAHADDNLFGPVEPKAVEFHPERHIDPMTLLPIEVNGRWGFADRHIKCAKHNTLTIGILLYIIAMWVSGIGQGIMLRAFDDFGNLQYTFVESVAFMHWPLVFRAIGGAFFVSGVVIMAFNIFMTIAMAKREAAAIEAKIAAKMARAS